MSKEYFSINGKILPAEQAVISVNDPAVTHGCSVFEEMRIENGVIWRFDEHLKRLSETIALVGLRASVTSGDLIEWAYDLIDHAGMASGKIRMTLTPGLIDAEPSAIFSLEPMVDYPMQWYEDGIGVVVSSFKQRLEDPLGYRNTGCYMPRLLAMQEAVHKKSLEAIWFTTSNYLAEGSMSNIFLVKNGVVLTPPISTPVFPGIARQAVIDLCKQLEIPFSGNDVLTVDDMIGADEIFLTSVQMKARPVVRIEQHTVGDEKVGETTKKIMAGLDELIKIECESREFEREGSGDGES